MRKYFSVLFWNLLSSLPTELKYSFYLQKTIRVFILTAVYIYCAALLQAKGHSGNNQNWYFANGIKPRFTLKIIFNISVSLVVRTEPPGKIYKINYASYVGMSAKTIQC